MGRGCGLMCALLAVVVFTPPVLAEETELADWARARWESYAVDEPASLTGALHPDGGTVFMGTPWDGFHYGEHSEGAWDLLRDWMTLDAVEVLEERVLSPGRLVWGRLAPRGSTTQTGEPVELAVASALVFAADGRIPAEDFIVLPGLDSGNPAPRWEEPLNPDAYAHHPAEGRTGMELWWRNGLAVMIVGVRAPGTGWVSVGFDPQRMMLGADFVIGAVREGDLIVEDHHGHLPTGHRRDSHEDALAAGGQIADGAVTLQFVIPLHSGDQDDNTLTPGESYTVLLAYHRSSTSLTTRHTSRSSLTITLDD
ncbi:MAG: DOMON domain-containing protein [Candidatus Bipolaricaulaceae bacterium]